jgi:hypothetical protein
MFSVGTDVSLLRNFSPQQKFWALGSTLSVNFHVAPKDGPYIWLSYFTPGRFTNTFTAVAKSPGTDPQIRNFVVGGKWNLRNVSVGWKHYLKGSFNEEYNWSLYGLAGLGLQFTKVQNDYKTAIDTALYTTNAPASGLRNVYGWTADLGLGIEYPAAPDFYFFSDVRTWLPVGGKESPYFHRNEKTPFPFTIGVGFRILFFNNY